MIKNFLDLCNKYKYPYLIKYWDGKVVLEIYLQGVKLEFSGNTVESCIMDFLEYLGKLRKEIDIFMSLYTK